MKEGVEFQGILATITPIATSGELSLGLKQVITLSNSSIPLKVSMVLSSNDLLELKAVDINLENKSVLERKGDSFKTDVEVTGLGSANREKKLQAWGGGGGIEDGGSLGDSGLGGNNQRNSNWDQFATQERMFGTRSDYHEEIYTTKLDRSGTDYRLREQRAAQLEKEILKVSNL